MTYLLRLTAKLIPTLLHPTGGGPSTIHTSSTLLIRFCCVSLFYCQYYWIGLVCPILGVGNKTTLISFKLIQILWTRSISLQTSPSQASSTLLSELRWGQQCTIVLDTVDKTLPSSSSPPSSSPPSSPSSTHLSESRWNLDHPSLPRKLFFSTRLWNWNISLGLRDSELLGLEQRGKDGGTLHLWHRSLTSDNQSAGVHT